MIHFFLHFDTELLSLIAHYGVWVYAIVFAIIFCETGLVIAPFLPGDSMLFALGAFAAQGSLDVVLLFVSLAGAAILGDSLNYALGMWLGEGLLHNPKQHIFKREHFEKAHAFYEKYGGKAILLSRFVPIVRTFAPFVAGVGEMSYRKFLGYNIAGGVIWVAFFLGLGFAVGNLHWVKEHFKFITFGLVFLSALPVIYEVWKSKKKN